MINGAILRNYLIAKSTVLFPILILFEYAYNFYSATLM